MEAKAHWEMVYSTKAPDAVSWYAPHLGESLTYIRKTGLSCPAAIIDVGGGEATLVDDLLAAGYSDVTVLDISETALQVAKDRLGEKAERVKWLVADALSTTLPARAFDIWHDRAVFHFLTTPEERSAYVSQVLRALRPGGFAIVGTFGPKGPDKCSGLPVARYTPDKLHGQFGARFSMVGNSVEFHTTPWGTFQQFTYCFCRLEH